MQRNKRDSKAICNYERDVLCARLSDFTCSSSLTRRDETQKELSKERLFRASVGLLPLPRDSPISERQTGHPSSISSVFPPFAQHP